MCQSKTILQTYKIRTLHPLIMFAAYKLQQQCQAEHENTFIIGKEKQMSDNTSWNVFEDNKNLEQFLLLLLFS